MAGMASWGCPAGGASAAISGIGSLGGRIQFGTGYGFGLMASGSHRARRRLRRRQNGLAAGLHVQLRYLRFYLRLELVGGAPELVECTPNLAANLRQLLGPEDDQGQQEDEEHLWKAQVHGLMILPERIAINRRRCGIGDMSDNENRAAPVSSFARARLLTPITALTKICTES